MQVKRGVRIGRPLGVPLHIHGSWLPAAALLVSHFALTVYRGEPPATAIGLSVASALAFFGSLVAHELAHALMARSLGIPVAGITLFIFGGVATIRREPSRPAQEVVIAAAGPLVSVVIGAGALFFAGTAQTGPGVFAWTIGTANLALAAFNLLPGFPLDGGRVLRAALWAIWKDAHRATLAAGRVGQAIGGLLAAAGLYLFLVVGGTDLDAGTAEGLWLAVVGVFLIVLATGARRAASVAATLRDELAGSWARPFAGALGPDAEPPAVWTAAAPYAVTTDGRLAGVLLPQTAGTWGARVRDLMVPWSPKLAYPAARPLTRALERLAADPSGVLVIMDESGAVVGVLDRAGVRARLGAPRRWLRARTG